MIVKTVIIVLVIICYVGYIETMDYGRYNLNVNNHEHIDAIFQRCSGYCNKKYCSANFTCRPHNRTSKYRILDLNFHVKIEAPINIGITTYKKFRTQYRPSVLGAYKEDLCKILLMQSHPIFTFFGLSKENGNLYDPCPLNGHRYEFPRYTSTWVGTMVPTGEWKLDFIISKPGDEVEEHILTLSAYALVKAKDAVGAEEF